MPRKTPEATIHLLRTEFLGGLKEMGLSIAIFFFSGEVEKLLPFFIWL